MLGFIVAVIAGFLTPQAEGVLARPVARMVQDHIRLEDGELRLLAFMLVMLLAGIAAVLLDSGSTFWVMVGGVIGYFGTRLIAAGQSVMNNRR